MWFDTNFIEFPYYIIGIRRIPRKISPSLTFLAGETISDLPDSVLDAPEVQAAMGKALTKNPAERYQRIDDMGVDLKAMRKTLRGDAKKSPFFRAGAPIVKPRVLSADELARVEAARDAAG